MYTILGLIIMTLFIYLLHIIGKFINEWFGDSHLPSVLMGICTIAAISYITLFAAFVVTIANGLGHLIIKLL